MSSPRRLQRGVPSNITTSGSDDPQGILHVPVAPANRARGIIDISDITLDDIPLAIEERLRKSKGVFSVQVNAFSKKLAVEFDPSVISLDKIMKMVMRPRQ